MTDITSATADDEEFGGASSTTSGGLSGGLGGSTGSMSPMTGDPGEARSFGTGSTGGSLGAGQSESGLLTQGLDTAQAKAQQARQWASQQGETFKQRVTAKPVESSVAVFGVGLIVGLLLARR